MPKGDGKVALRLGIVGCGAVAQLMYVKTLSAIRAVSVDYVADLNSESAMELAARFGAKPSSLEQIQNETDAVIVATPPGTHYEIVKACLRPGRIVICEKPFVGFEAQALELIGSAEAQGAKLYVGHFRRTFPALKVVRGLAGSGTLGSLRRIVIAEGGRFGWSTQSGYVNADPMGGVLFDTGSHAIDMALFAACLDDKKFAVKATDVFRDRPEPAHEIRAAFSLSGEFDTVEVELRLSRYESLANMIRFDFENGQIHMPVGLRSAIRLTGRTGTQLIRLQDQYENHLECFVAQWRAIFEEEDADTFGAKRFVGLTSILEALSNQVDS